MKLKTENSADRLYKIFIYVVLGILAVLILVPVLWVMVASVKETSEHYGSPWALPSHIHLIYSIKRPCIYENTAIWRTVS